MTWDEFYEKSNYWAVSTIVNKIGSLEDMGVPDEIVDVLNIIGFEDKKGATRLLNRALQQEVKFSGENLVEICDLCSEEGFKNALYQSADKLTATDLEELYGNIDDNVIIEVANMCKLKLPEEMREEYEEEPENEEDTKDELMWKIQSATQAADYALQCLYNAQEAMYDSSNVSFINMMNKGFLTSLWKYSSLSDADSELQIAQNALQNMNIELQDLLGNKTVQLNYKSLASAFDLWVESNFMDCLVHLQIGRAQKKIRQAIKQVEAIRRELGRIL